MFLTFFWTMLDILTSEISQLNTIVLGGSGLSYVGFFTIMIGFVCVRILINNLT